MKCEIKLNEEDNDFLTDDVQEKEIWDDIRKINKCNKVYFGKGT